MVPTHKEEILIYLRQYRENIEEWLAPYGVCQEGISFGIGIEKPNLKKKYLKPLMDKKYIEEKKMKVVDCEKDKLVYFLTEQGRSFADKLKKDYENIKFEFIKNLTPIKKAKAINIFIKILETFEIGKLLKYIDTDLEDIIDDKYDFPILRITLKMKSKIVKDLILNLDKWNEPHSGWKIERIDDNNFIDIKETKEFANIYMKENDDFIEFKVDFNPEFSITLEGKIFLKELEDKTSCEIKIDNINNEIIDFNPNVHMFLYWPNEIFNRFTIEFEKYMKRNESKG